MPRRRKSIQFAGYRTKDGELVQCKEVDYPDVRDKHKGNLRPKYDRMRRR